MEIKLDLIIEDVIVFFNFKFYLDLNCENLDGLIWKLQKIQEILKNNTYEDSGFWASDSTETLCLSVTISEKINKLPENIQNSINEHSELQKTINQMNEVIRNDHSTSYESWVFRNNYENKKRELRELYENIFSELKTSGLFADIIYRVNQ